MAAQMQRIRVQIVGDRGLVWNIEDVLRLRKQHRLIGCMVGGIAGYQSQVSVLGLPLQLSLEEVSLAAAAGWIELYQACFSTPTAAAAAAQEAATIAQPPAADTSQQAAVQQQQEHDPMQVDEDAEMDEFYAAYYGLDLPQQQQQQQAPLQQQPLQQKQLQQQQQPPKKQQQQQWQLALKSNNKFAIPLTIAEAAAVSADEPSSAAEGDAAAAENGEQQQQQSLLLEGAPAAATTSSSSNSSSPYCRCEPTAWQYPCTALQWLRLCVFADLHSKGFSVTGGAKFGGDFLAYPGDPHLYHAQYVVRVLLPDQAQKTSVLQGLARGVHAARKHLVLATVQDTTVQAAGGAGAALVGDAAAAAGMQGAVARSAQATAAAVGGLRLTYALDGVGGGDAGGDDDMAAAAAAAAAVSAAAAQAACDALFHGMHKTGPVQIAHSLGEPAAAAAGGASSCEAATVNGNGAAATGAAECGVSLLQYITISRETGWAAEKW